MQSQNFKPDYAGQPAHESLPRACIEVYDVVMTIEGKANRNEFYNSNWGIYAHHSYIVVSNCKFNNMRKGGPAYGNATHKGAALVAESTSPASAGKLTVLPLYNHDITIDTCQWGVYTEWTNATVTNVSMRNVNLSGVFNIRCNDAVMSTTISNCDIEAAKTGIQWQNSEKGIMKAVNNRIKVWSGGNAVGIKLISTGANTGNYQITGNIIEATNGSGITASSAKNVNVINNTIKLSGNTNNGVSIAGCDSSQVSCNSVSGRYPVLNYNNYGIYGSLNTGCYLSCNTTDSTKTGIYFGGSNLGTKFRGNEMKRHNIGLYLNNTAVIDTQTHAGNMWTGVYNSNYGAWNENDSSLFNLTQSLFIVDPNLGATFNPNIPFGVNPGEPNDQGWFLQDTGNTFNCAGYLLCEDMSSSLLQNGSVDLKEAIALDSILSTDFKEESKSIAKISLYENLQKDSLEYSSNPVLMQFLNDNANTTFGKLNNVKQMIKEAFVLDSSNAILLKEKDSLITVYLNNVNELDSIAAADSTVDNLAARETELITINDLQQERASILIQATNLQKLDNAKSINNSVQPNELPEYNLKLVYEISIVYEKNNKDSIAQYYATLLNIAEQCPYSGGKAVYMARGLVALFNDTIMYEDESNCLLQGYYRLQNVQPDIEENMGIRIIPNPANTFADVELNSSYEGICRIIITDIYSKKLSEQTFDCKNRQYRIRTEKYKSGVYNLKIQINDKIIKVARLIIVR